MSTLQYRLIHFIPSYQKIYSYLSYEYTYSYSISDIESTDEYDYQGFENDYRSLDKVLAHAAAMIKRLERDKWDESSRASLRRDYYNAIKCLTMGKHGDREGIDNFTKYMLIEEPDTVIDVLTKAYSENQSKSDDQLLDYLYIPDYSLILVKAADKALFDDENDLDKALSEYRIATYEWRSKYIREDNNKYLPISIKHRIRSYIDLFLSIKDGMPYNGDLSFLSDYEKTIVTEYQLIENKYSHHVPVVEEIEALIDKIEDSIHNYPFSRLESGNPIFGDKYYNALRIICYLIPTLFRFGLLDEIKLLSEETKLPSDSIREEAIKKIKYFRQSEYEWISQIIPQIDEKKRWKVLSAISRVEDDINRIKEKLLIKGNVPQLAYYTSWETLSYMLPTGNKEKDMENVGRFSVMHFSYMNDPMEGNVINDFLGLQEISERKEYLEPYAFVKCFTQSIDYLPMWKMYGNNAEGCCIVINWNRIKEINKGKHIELYKVCYLTKQKNGYKFVKADNNNDKNLNELGELLEKLRKDVQQIKSLQEKWNLIGPMLGKLAYLFKDSSYSYEKEARILYTLNKQNSRIKRTDQIPPKLYVHSDYCIAIDELILGPKFRDVYLWSPFIKLQLEKMNEIAGYECATKLSLSNINYR